MKKILAIFLALIMLLSVMSVALVSCTDDNKGTAGTTGDDDDGGLVAANKNNNDDDDEENNGDNIENNSSSETWTTFASPKTIYCVADDVRVRTSANYNGTNNVLKKINTGDSVTATAKSNDTEAWYKVTIDGQEAYILAEYMTEDQAETVFVALDNPETLTFKTPTSNNEYKTKLRIAPAFGAQTEYITLNKDNMNGALVKIAVNQSGNIWKVQYTETGKEAKIYYIGNGAFGNFVGYNETSGGLG